MSGEEEEEDIVVRASFGESFEGGAVGGKEIEESEGSEEIEFFRGRGESERETECGGSGEGVEGIGGELREEFVD